MKNEKLENNSIPVLITDKIFDEIDPEMWKDPSKKFCYASIVDDYIIRKFYDKLNEGLKEIIIDDEKRYNHIWDNMIYGIALDKARAKLVKTFSEIKNIYIKNISEDDLTDMPKFDYIIQNPPYNKSLHLDFLKAGYNMLNERGKMVIIEPSTWLINIRKNGKAKLYNEIKTLLKNHVNKVVIENYNKEFNTGLYAPFAITYIDKYKQFNNIDFYCCGKHTINNSIYDCNLIGNYKTIWNILNKINCDKVRNHIYKKTQLKNNNYYCKYVGIIGRGICADPRTSDVWYRNNLYAASYYWVSFDDRVNICQNPLKSLKSGYTYENPVYSDKIVNNLYDTKEHLENYKYNVFNTKIIPFINIICYVDQNNNSLDYVPWLVDKKYTDDEINELFGFTDEEIKLIDKTIKKYERNSPWFKRYMCGPSSVSDEEVQKFMDELENA